MQATKEVQSLERFGNKLKRLFVGEIPEWTLSREGKDLGFRQKAFAIRRELIERIELAGILEGEEIIAGLGTHEGSSTVTIGFVDPDTRTYRHPLVDDAKPISVENLGSKVDKNGNSYRGMCVFPYGYNEEPYVLISFFGRKRSLSLPFHECDGGTQWMLKTIENGFMQLPYGFKPRKDGAERISKIRKGIPYQLNLDDSLHEATILNHRRFQKSYLS